MTRIYERRHAHWQGAIVAIITEHAPTQFSITVRIFGSDGVEAQQHGGETYTNLRDAQDAADAHVYRLGHPQCSAACAPWPTDATN